MLPISLLDSPGALAWDSLPLVKLTCFPFAHGHTLPFSQARLAALEGRELRIRMWSFEVGAPMDSRLGMLLCRGGHALSFVLSPGRPCEAMIKEKGGWAPVQLFRFVSGWRRSSGGVLGGGSFPSALFAVPGVSRFYFGLGAGFGRDAFGKAWAIGWRSLAAPIGIPSPSSLKQFPPKSCPET